jgi:hypothetical protein
MTAFSVAPDRDDRKAEVAARQAAARRGRFHIARGELDLCAQAFERFQVQVDRAVADRAAAGQRHGRLAGTGEQRAEHQNRRPHLAHHVVGRDGRSDFLGLEGHAAAELAFPDARDLGRNAKHVEQMSKGVDVGEARQIGEGQLLVGEKRARHQGQRRVLRSADRDLAVEAVAALDPDAVHRGALALGGIVTSSGGQAFSSVHCSGCWFSRAKSITCVTLVSATS